MTQPIPTERWFEQFGVDDAVCARVLEAATAHGADDADLFFEHDTSTSIGMSDGKVNRAHTTIDLGVGVRVVVGDQVGYAYTEDLSPQSMVDAARTAAQIAHGGRWRAPQPTSNRNRPDYYPVARLWSDVAVDERVPLVRQWEEWAFSADSRIKKVQVHLADVDKRVLIVRADGGRASDYRPMTRAFVSVTAVEDDLRETGDYNLASRAGLDFYTPDRQRRLVDIAVKRAIDALHAGSPPAGEMPVVLANGSSGILLHEAIGHGMEADFNRKGISIYADRVGTRIAPAEVTVVDDGTIPGARGSINVDDEGNEGRKTVLVRDGILESFLHDEISARHYGVAPTGSGRRESFRHPVLPRMRSTYMEPGPHDPEDIIKSVDKGLYCETFSNGQVQIGAGDFAFYVRQGYLIEGGKLTKPVKDVNLIGNGPDVLAAIEMVGNDLVIDESGWTCGKDGQSVPVSQGMPTVKVSKLSVGGSMSSELYDVANAVVGKATALGAGEVSVTVTQGWHTTIQRRLGKVEQATQATNRGLVVSLLVDERYSSHSTSDLRQDALDAFLRRAIDATRYLEPDPDRAQPDLAACGRGASEEELDQWDPAWADRTAEERAADALALEAELDARRPAGHVSSAVFVADGGSHSVRAMSNGFTGEHRGAWFQAGGELTLNDEGGKRPESSAYFAMRYLADLPGTATIAQEVVDRGLERLGAKPIASGTYPMLLSNRVAGRLLGALLGPMSGGSIHEGRSCLAGKAGARIGSDLLTVIDDPLVRRGLASRPWDGDGLRAVKRTVLDRGVLQGYYLSTYYARKLGMDATTGGRSNWIVPAGTRTVEQMAAALPKAILVDGFLGGNSNGATGDFSFGIRGLLLEHGQPAGALAEMNVSGNLLTVFDRLVELGSDVYPYSSVYSPTLLFDAVQFSGT